jgi:PAS domain S-box-containing protein
VTSPDPAPGDAGRHAVVGAVDPLHLLIASVRDYAIFLLDPQGHVATWNLGAERIKGYRADEIIGKHFSQFYPQADIDAGKCEFELEVAAREGRFEDEGWRLRKDGTTFWANVVITALRDPSGALVGFAKVTRDLTERVQAEQARLQLGREAHVRLQALSDLSAALAPACTTADVGAVVAEVGTACARADTCMIYLLDEATRRLRLLAQRGCHPDLVARLEEIGPESPVYRVGTGEAPSMWIEDERAYAALYPALSELAIDGARARAFWCVPLVAEGRTLGLVGAGFYVERAFSQEEREFIGALARQCAQAIARAGAYEKEREAAGLVDRLRSSLATTLKSIGDAVIATDTAGAVTLMNGVAEALTGWSEADAIGRALPDVFRIVNEHTRASVTNPVERVLESGGVVGLANHTLLISRGGRDVPIDDSGAPIRDEQGAITGVVLVFRDVTERKRDEAQKAFLDSATRALSESLDYERSVARVAELAVPALADWCAVDLVAPGSRSPKRLAVAHVDPAKVEMAKELDARYPPDPDAKTGVPNVLRTGLAEVYGDIPDELLVAGCVDAEHLRIARALGLRSAMIVPFVARGRVLGAMTFVFAESGRAYDASQLRFAEELARRCATALENALHYAAEQQARLAADLASRAKDEFLAVVSHELRTPLNAILGWAKMLTSWKFEEARQKSALETIQRNAVAMAQLIEDLLDMSRVISGKMRLDAQRIELAPIVEAAIDSVRPAAAARGVDVVATLDPVVVVLGDPTRLQQIAWNLLSNAVKFSRKGGRVDVVLTADDASASLVVADSGKGIAPEFLPWVFEPFRQEDASTSRAIGGLGLGLAITRRLVELHGGHVRAESAGLAQGARFTVTLPVRAGDAAQQGAPSVAPARRGEAFERPQQLRGLRVLVVDDDADARDVVAAVLRECGCVVTTVDGAEAALARIAAEVPDVLLSDIAMPGQDGFELIAKVRALPRGQGGDVPAAALTAYARPEDRRRMLNAGFSIHLPKPIEPAELVAVVATLSRFIQAPGSDTP